MKILGFGNKAVTPSVRDLSEETRADMNALLEDGVLPSEVAKEYGVPLTVVQSIRRMQIRKRDEAKKPEVKEKADPMDEMIRSMTKQMQLAQLQFNMDKMKQDQDYEMEKRKLELEIKRLELEQKRAELYEEDDDDEEEKGDITNFIDDEGNPNLFGFLKELVVKNREDSSPAHNQRVPEESKAPPAAGMPDLSKPLDDAALDEYLKRVPAGTLALAKVASRAKIKKELVAQFPNITEENIKKIIDKVKQ